MDLQKDDADDIPIAEFLAIAAVALCIVSLFVGAGMMAFWIVPEVPGPYPGTLKFAATLATWWALPKAVDHCIAAFPPVASPFVRLWHRFKAAEYRVALAGVATSATLMTLAYLAVSYGPPWHVPRGIEKAIVDRAASIPKAEAQAAPAAPVAAQQPMAQHRRRRKQ